MHLYRAFLYPSLPSLHDYDVNMPNFTFYGGRKQATTNFSFSFLTWERSPRNQLQGKGGWLHLTSQFQSYLNPLSFSLPYYSLPTIISTPATPATYTYHRLYFLFSLWSLFYDHDTMFIYLEIVNESKIIKNLGVAVKEKKRQTKQY